MKLKFNNIYIRKTTNMENNKSKIEDIKNDILNRLRIILKSDPVVRILSKAGEQLIVVGTLGVVLYFVLSSLFVSSNNALREANRNVKEIQAKINVIGEDQTELIDKVQTLEENQLVFSDLISRNNKLLEQNSRELKNLKKIYNEKISHVDNYNYGQLDSFFAKRYKQYKGQHDQGQ